MNIYINEGRMTTIMEVFAVFYCLALYDVYCYDITNIGTFLFTNNSRIVSSTDFDCFSAASVLDCVNTGFKHENSCALNFNLALNQCCLDLSGCCMHSVEEEFGWISAKRESGHWFNWSPWSACTGINGPGERSRVHFSDGGSPTCNEVIFDEIDCLPRDCGDITPGNVSGIYDIYPDQSQTKLSVYCELEKNGGGWTVFQTRKDGTVNFTRNWYNYKVGFGQIGQEMWLGNENIHKITSNGNFKLRIELKNFDGLASFAEYTPFAIGNELSQYAISIGSFSGTAGDSLSYHNGMGFSTTDVDNDNLYGVSCASQDKKGGWWYDSCAEANLNGLYFTSAGNGDAVYWKSWTGYNRLQETIMMVKRV